MYKASCWDCDDFYIGKTKRRLHDRKTEHFKALTKNCQASANRETKFHVTWSYVKRQTAKMKLWPSDFSSLNSRVKIFVFVANSRRHFSIFYVI